MARSHDCKPRHIVLCIARVGLLLEAWKLVAIFVFMHTGAVDIAVVQLAQLLSMCPSSDMRGLHQQ